MAHGTPELRSSVKLKVRFFSVFGRTGRTTGVIVNDRSEMYQNQHIPGSGQSLWRKGPKRLRLCLNEGLSSKEIASCDGATPVALAVHFESAVDNIFRAQIKKLAGKTGNGV